ncbi:MAG TPA: MFS transporter [Tepidisphaeraceae bacterium]|jgi:ACS family hexuronate transporter-like MFS transporter
MTHFRWVILALVFFGTTVNYMDRLVLGVLAPDLKRQFAITDEGYGHIQAAFALSYALGQLVSGRVLDWIGTRLGYAIALFGWSIASILHVVARSAFGFGAARSLLGVCESPNFPAAVKVLSEWFPKRERALGMGVVNSGTIAGAVLVPLVVPPLVVRFGWRAAFVFTGLIGLLWLFFWLPVYGPPRGHKRVSARELALIESDPPETSTSVRWATLLTFPQTWAFVIGKFLTDPLWWFYMTWFPSFLNKQYGLNISQIGTPLFVIYGMATVGSLAGGWLSSAMLKNGFGVNASRKTAMLVCALAVVPVVFAANVTGLWTSVMLMGLATAAHQGFSSNLYTLVPDMFPKHACGSVAGIGGSAGYMGATLFSSLTGLIVGRWTNQNYSVLFIIAGLGYLVSFIIIQILAPRLEPAAISDEVAGFDVVVPGKEQRS